MKHHLTYLANNIKSLIGAHNSFETFEQKLRLILAKLFRYNLPNIISGPPTSELVDKTLSDIHESLTKGDGELGMIYLSTPSLDPVDAASKYVEDSIKSLFIDKQKSTMVSKKFIWNKTILSSETKTFGQLSDGLTIPFTITTIPGSTSLITNGDPGNTKEVNNTGNFIDSDLNNQSSGPINGQTLSIELCEMNQMIPGRVYYLDGLKTNVSTKVIDLQNGLMVPLSEITENYGINYSSPNIPWSRGPSNIFINDNNEIVSTPPALKDYNGLAAEISIKISRSQISVIELEFSVNKNEIPPQILNATIDEIQYSDFASTFSNGIYKSTLIIPKVYASNISIKLIQGYSYHTLLAHPASFVDTVMKLSSTSSSKLLSNNLTIRKRQETSPIQRGEFLVATPLSDDAFNATDYLNDLLCGLDSSESINILNYSIDKHSVINEIECVPGKRWAMRINKIMIGDMSQTVSACELRTREIPVPKELIGIKVDDFLGSGSIKYFVKIGDSIIPISPINRNAIYPQWIESTADTISIVAFLDNSGPTLPICKNIEVINRATI